MEGREQLFVAEYTAIRSEMQSITTARYTVLALTITAIAAILAAMLTAGERLPNPEVIAPLAILAVLFPSTIVNLTLSTQFHRLSSYNIVFGQPNLRQQQAFEIYARKKPHHWAYVKPLAFTYAWLLGGTAGVLLVSFWSCQMLVAVLVLIGMHMWPILRLWNASLTGVARKEDIELWTQIKEEMSHAADSGKPVSEGKSPQSLS